MTRNTDAQYLSLKRKLESELNTNEMRLVTMKSEMSRMKSELRNLKAQVRKSNEELIKARASYEREVGHSNNAQLEFQRIQNERSSSVGGGTEYVSYSDAEHQINKIKTEYSERINRLRAEAARLEIEVKEKLNELTQVAETKKRKYDESRLDKSSLDRDFSLAQRKLDEGKRNCEKHKSQMDRHAMLKRQYEEHAESLERSIAGLEPKVVALEGQVRGTKQRLMQLK